MDSTSDYGLKTRQVASWLWLRRGALSTVQKLSQQSQSFNVDIYVGTADRFWLFIFTLNRAKKWFNSIFNSKLIRKYSFNKIIHSILNKKYSFNEIIHSNWKTNHSLSKQWKTMKNRQKGPVLSKKGTFIHFSYE